MVVVMRVAMMVDVGDVVICVDLVVEDFAFGFAQRLVISLRGLASEVFQTDAAAICWGGGLEVRCQTGLIESGLGGVDGLGSSHVDSDGDDMVRCLG
jgi:hypothetical protein